MNREAGYYWIKWSKMTEWEIAKYNPETDYFHGTNGSKMSAKSVLEIDENKIKKNKKNK
jgi:hypothetical protein